MTLIRSSVARAALTAAFLIQGCSGATPIAPDHRAPHLPSDVSLSMFSLGDLERAVPRQPCRAPQHRQFDFWLGTRDVTASGTFAGHNDIRSEVDGCVIAEYWTGSNGIQGWSLNAYDPADGMWHQHWVTEAGVNLRLSGGWNGTSMVISGPRTLPDGSTVIDRIAYTPLAGSTMRQFWDISADGGETFPTIAFDGQYQPNPNIQPPASPGATACLAPAYTSDDFLVGDWIVETEHGRRLGTASIASELSHCVLVERFRTDKGLQWKSFLSYGRVVGQWFLTRVTSEAERLALVGTAQGSALVLEGQTAEPSGRKVRVRVTITPESANTVRHVTDLSRDGGTTWREALTVIYRRAS